MQVNNFVWTFLMDSRVASSYMISHLLCPKVSVSFGSVWVWCWWQAWKSWDHGRQSMPSKCLPMMGRHGRSGWRWGPTRKYNTNTSASSREMTSPGSIGRKVRIVTIVSSIGMARPLSKMMEKFPASFKPASFKRTKNSKWFPTIQNFRSWGREDTRDTNGSGCCDLLPNYAYIKSITKRVHQINDSVLCRVWNQYTNKFIHSLFYLSIPWCMHS